MNKANIIEQIEKNKIIVILRGLDQEELLQTVDAMEKGGIRLAEVTFNSNGNPSDETIAGYIHTLAEHFAGKVHVGAGTVLTPRQAELAFNAGAEFIISPDTNPEVIQKTRELGMVSIPGAMTASEVMQAHRAGADFIKLFPTDELGLSYLKALMAPLSQIRFLAVGGVTVENIADYIRAGAYGAGIGTGIANRGMIKTGDFAGITKLAERYVAALHAIKED